MQSSFHVFIECRRIQVTHASTNTNRCANFSIIVPLSLPLMPIVTVRTISLLSGVPLGSSRDDIRLCQPFSHIEQELCCLSVETYVLSSTAYTALTEEVPLVH